MATGLIIYTTIADFLIPSLHSFLFGSGTHTQFLVLSRGALYQQRCLPKLGNTFFFSYPVFSLLPVIERGGREGDGERDEGIKNKTSHQINPNCFTTWKGDTNSSRSTATAIQRVQGSQGPTGRGDMEDHTGLRECTEKGLHDVLQVLLDLWRCCHSHTGAIISGKLVEPLCAWPVEMTRTQGNSLLATRGQSAREGLRATSQVQLRGARLTHHVGKLWKNVKLHVVYWSLWLWKLRVTNHSGFLR